MPCHDTVQRHGHWEGPSRVLPLILAHVSALPTTSRRWFHLPLDCGSLRVELLLLLLLLLLLRLWLMVVVVVVVLLLLLLKDRKGEMMRGMGVRMRVVVVVMMWIPSVVRTSHRGGWMGAAAPKVIRHPL